MKLLSFVAIAGVSLLLSASVAFAQTEAHTPSGLVPCGGVSGPGNFLGATECGLCDLVPLSQNIINFLLMLTVPLSVGLFAWAGVLYFTSGGNPKNITRAHNIFRSVIIGFVIALSAWLVVQTILHALVKKNFFTSGSWNSLVCYPDVDRPRESTLGQLFSLIQTSGTVEVGRGNNSTVNPVTVSDPQMAANLQAACTALGMTPNGCAIATRIAQQESSGGRNCTTSATGAAGCMQVLARTACGIDSNTSSACGACTASGNSTSPACAPVIQTISNNPALGAALGVQYIQQLEKMPQLQTLMRNLGSCQVVAAAYYRGPGAVTRAGGIPPAATSYVAKACGS